MKKLIQNKLWKMDKRLIRVIKKFKSIIILYGNPRVNKLTYTRINNRKIVLFVNLIKINCILPV
jgi:hypothetical protein